MLHLPIKITLYKVEIKAYRVRLLKSCRAFKKTITDEN